MYEPSMDDQYREMKNFCEELSKFNLRLRATMTDLRHHHEQVAPLWQDEMRKQYDSEWAHLAEMMYAYDRYEGPRYVEGLHIKLGALERYLRGG